MQEMSCNVYGGARGMVEAEEEGEGKYKEVEYIIF